MTPGAGGSGAGGSAAGGAAPWDECEVGVRLPDGSCLLAGVPDGACGEGFEPDGNFGCQAILPAEACGAGTLALPGETSCRPVRSCGQGTWGDIPIDGFTVHVDASHTGGSNGSIDQPFTSIGAAVASAAPGDRIAVAAGTYVEQVVVDRGVTIMGVCPEQVIVRPPNASSAGFGVIGDGARISGLTVTGPGFGIGVDGGDDLVIDHVHLHDLGRNGVYESDGMGPAGVEIRDSLIEHTVGAGVVTLGGALSITRSVVRDVAAFGEVTALITPGPGTSSGVPADVEITASILERGPLGVHAGSSHVVVKDSLVRDMSVGQSLNSGIGVMVRPAGDVRPSVRLETTVFEDLRIIGAVIVAGDLEADRVTVRRVVEATHLVPIGIYGQPAPGYERTTVSVTDSAIGAFGGMGIFVQGGDATITGTAIHDLGESGHTLKGGGIQIQRDTETDEPTTVVADGLLIDNVAQGGIIVSRSAFRLSGSAILRSNALSDDSFGDALAIVQAHVDGTPQRVDNCRLEDSARVGLAIWGTRVALADTRVACQPIDLNGEAVEAEPFELINEGGNECGCPAVADLCQVLSAGLVPPTPIDQ